MSTQLNDKATWIFRTILTVFIIGPIGWIAASQVQSRIQAAQMVVRVQDLKENVVGDISKIKRDIESHQFLLHKIDLSVARIETKLEENMVPTAF